MGKYWIIGLTLWLLSLPILFAQNITGYEYWIDDDFSNKVFTSVTPTSSLLINENIDFSTEEDGLHIFNIRFIDENNKWSSPLSYFFYKPVVQASGANTITSYEYWFDDDFDALVNTNVTQDVQVSINRNVEMNALDNGLHLFNVRFKNAASLYSTVLSKFVYKLPLTISNNKIIEIQYWIDNDMASSQNIAISSASSVVIDENLDLSTLNSGMHLFNIRVKDENGLWSSTKSQFFYKKETTVTDNVIVKYQYWIDDDIENSTTVSVTNNASFELLDDIDFSAVMAGLHNLQIRFQDAQGTWSSTLGQDFLKVAQSLDDHLWAYYKFDGDANDYSSNEHHGVSYGEVSSVADNFGNSNGAYGFDGIDDYIDLGTWTNGGAMSISFWARWDAFNNYSRIVDLGNGSSSNNIIVSNYQTGGRFFFQIYSTSTVGITTPSSVVDLGVWNYYTVTVDESGYMKSYMNGSIVAEGTGVLPRTVERAKQYVGKSNFTQDGFFNGAIDELRIYNKVLTEDEISGLYSYLPTNIPNEIIPLSGIELYPNPITDNLYIDIKQDGDYIVSIFDISGKIVLQQKCNGLKSTISLSNYESGLYIVRLQLANSFKLFKVIKK